MLEDGNDRENEFGMQVHFMRMEGSLWETLFRCFRPGREEKKLGDRLLESPEGGQSFVQGKRGFTQPTGLLLWGGGLDRGDRRKGTAEDYSKMRVTSCFKGMRAWRDSEKRKAWKAFWINEGSGSRVDKRKKLSRALNENVRDSRGTECQWSPQGPGGVMGGWNTADLSI